MYKKLILFSLFFFPLYSFAYTDVLDFYSGSNLSNGDWYLPADTNVLCQAFNSGKGGLLYSITPYLRKVGSPTQLINVDLYAHAGIYGSTSVISGNWLARTKLDTSLLTTGSTVPYEIIFSDSYFLAPNTYYVFCIDGTSLVYPTGYIRIGVDTSSSLHSGVLLYGDTPALATAYTPNDFIFKVTATSTVPVVAFSLEQNLFYGFILFFLAIIAFGFLFPRNFGKLFI